MSQAEVSSSATEEGDPAPPASAPEHGDLAPAATAAAVQDDPAPIARTAEQGVITEVEGGERALSDESSCNFAAKPFTGRPLILGLLIGLIIGLALLSMPMLHFALIQILFPTALLLLWIVKRHVPYIKVSRDDMQLSWNSFLLQPKQVFDWDNLISVRAALIKGIFGKRREFLDIYYPQRKLRLPLWAFSFEQREKLFTIIAKHVPPEKMSPEALYLQVQALSGNKIASSDGFTQMWADQFNRKFELSNHIALSPGTVVSERFTILMTLSVRMNQTVYLAQTKSGQRVVLKELVTANDADEEFKLKTLEQFEREAQILARLSHPFIVKITDHYVDQGRSYIVMEYVGGDNLREYVRLHGKLAEPDAVKIAMQMADMVEYLHSQHPPVIHRDLTPENLMYSGATKQTWLIDFGAASTFLANGTATLIGKQSYMPPEQFRGKAEPASDIYAFAATIYFLLTGRDPEPMAVGSIEGLRAESLNALIADCTCLDPAKRLGWGEIEARLKSCAQQLQPAPL